MKQLFLSSPALYLICWLLLATAVGFGLQALINKKENRPPTSFELYRAIWCFAAGMIFVGLWMRLLVHGGRVPEVGRFMVLSIQDASSAYMLHLLPWMMRNPKSPDQYRPRWWALAIVLAAYIALNWRIY